MKYYLTMHSPSGKTLCAKTMEAFSEERALSLAEPLDCNRWRINHTVDGPILVNESTGNYIDVM